MSVQPIRQNSTDKVSIGPAVSISDGFTLLSTLTLSGADSARAKLGDDSTVDISGYTWAATTNMDGEYDLTLQTGITDTIGPMTIVVEDVSLCLPIREKFYVYDPTVYDALFADTPTLLTSKDIGQLYEGDITTVNSQTSFDMAVAIVSDDVWIGQTVSITDRTNGEPFVTYVTDVDQTNDRILTAVAPPFTVVGGGAGVGDTVRVESRVHPTYALGLYDPPTRTEATADKDAILTRLGTPAGADIAADLATIDGNVDAILVDTVDLQARMPAALSAGGYMKAAVITVNGRIITGIGTDVDPFQGGAAE